MENLGPTGSPKARSPRLMWLRFPLLAALLVNVVLVLRVPVAQFTQDRESAQQVARAADAKSKVDAPPITADPPDAEPPGDALVVQPPPSQSAAPQPAPAAQPLPPRPSTDDPPASHQPVDLQPAVQMVMAGIGDRMAQATSARTDRTGELADQLAAAIGRFGQHEPASMPPAAADNPPALMTPPHAADPQQAVDPQPQPTTLAHSNHSTQSPAILTPPQVFDPPPAPEPAAVQIVLKNSRRSRNVFHFVVDNQVVSLSPGEQWVASGRPLVVRFHRGAQFGYAQYTLHRGAYEFRVGERGWEIAQVER